MRWPGVIGAAHEDSAPYAYAAVHEKLTASSMLPVPAYRATYG